MADRGWRALVGAIKETTAVADIDGRSKQRVEFPSNIHGGGHEAIGVALLGDIADARESEVIADERELILHRHVETPLARLGASRDRRQS